MPELGRPLGNLRHPVLGLAHHHRGGQRHAALSRGAKRGPDKGVEGALLVGVRHDHAVVLGAHVALHPLAVGIASLVNVLPRLVPANKTGNNIK